ncbi:MAG: hypothetical protein GY710_23605 [Desulfobacteraceae bacterium]|nr:hypothetical protein [Desulfobacteraceae bacterium]
MEIKWGLNIQTKSDKGKFSHWYPMACAKNFIVSPPMQLNHWLDLAGTNVSWKKPYGPDDDPYATLYVFEHEPIFNSKITINRKEKSLYIKWGGLSDVNCNLKYGQSLSLEIETELFFKGIWFGRESEADSKALLSQFLDPNLFKFIKTEHEISLFQPK